MAGSTIRKAIALLQILVLLSLTVSAGAIEPLPGQGHSAISQSAQSHQDTTPCCPDQDQSETDSNTCSSCSYCTAHIPMTPQVSASYSPSVTPLTAPERFSSLPEIHMPIVVPPQNIC